MRTMKDMAEGVIDLSAGSRLVPVPAGSADVSWLQEERLALGEFLCQIGIINGRDLAQQLIDHFGSLSATLNADCEALLFAGFHDKYLPALLAKLQTLLFVRDREKLRDSESVLTPTALKEFALTCLKGKGIVQGIALFFDRKCKPLSQMLTYDGCIDRVEIYHTEVLRKALCLRASHVATVHNQPSGDSNPSGGDIRDSHELQDKLRMVKITYLDHVIASAHKATSLREQHLL